MQISTAAPGLEMSLPLTTHLGQALLAAPRCPVPLSVASSDVSWVLLCH